jgi:hypothetical protein
MDQQLGGELLTAGANNDDSLRHGDNWRDGMEKLWIGE